MSVIFARGSTTPNVHTQNSPNSTCANHIVCKHIYGILHILDIRECYECLRHAPRALMMTKCGRVFGEMLRTRFECGANVSPNAFTDIPFACMYLCKRARIKMQCMTSAKCETSQTHHRTQSEWPHRDGIAIANYYCAVFAHVMNACYTEALVW